MPLTEKQRKFVEVYAGDATRAAELAGYQGDRNTLAVRGHKLRHHPEIAALISARAQDGATPASLESRRGSPLPPADDDDSEENIRVLESIRDDSTTLASHRIQAVERIERIKQRRLEREAAAGGGDQMQRLRAKIAEVLKAKRERRGG